MKNNQFRTLAKFATLEEAQVVMALLDSMGVNAQILNDTVAMIMPYLESDVRIIVNTEDYDKARVLLDARFNNTDIPTPKKK